MIKPTKQDKIGILKDMLKIRIFEKNIESLFSKGEIYGTTHLYTGQEANAVGVCTLLKKEDLVGSGHRGHGHAIAKGLDMKYLMAEILGKETGYCKGKGGTQHVSAIDKGFIGTNGITGGFVPIALGAAMTSKKTGKNYIVVSFFGDGALGEGVVLESFNIAALWKLPVIFYCENNLYAMSTPVSEAIAVDDITSIPRGFGIKTFVADGNNVLDVMDKTNAAIDLIKKGEGPVFIEAKTYRYFGHSKSDMREYRTRDEEAHWQKKCPIERLKKSMIEDGDITEEDFTEIEEGVAKEVEHAVSFAKNSKEISQERIFEDLY